MASKKDTPPKGGVVETPAYPHAADEAARRFVTGDPGPDLAPSGSSITFNELTSTTPPDPASVFQWLDRSWRPMLGVVCGAGFFYSFVAAPVTDRREVDEAKLWVLCTLALGLAGVKTAERLGPGMVGRAQGLMGGPPLVTR